VSAFVLLPRISLQNLSKSNLPGGPFGRVEIILNEHKLCMDNVSGIVCVKM